MEIISSRQWGSFGNMTSISRWASLVLGEVLWAVSDPDLEILLPLDSSTQELKELTAVEVTGQADYSTPQKDWSVTQRFPFGGCLGVGTWFILPFSALLCRSFLSLQDAHGYTEFPCHAVWSSVLAPRLQLRSTGQPKPTLSLGGESGLQFCSPLRLTPLLFTRSLLFIISLSEDN